MLSFIFNDTSSKNSGYVWSKLFFRIYEYISIFYLFLRIKYSIYLYTMEHRHTTLEKTKCAFKPLKPWILTLRGLKMLVTIRISQTQRF